MIRSFISISFILFINFNVLASGFEKLTPEEIGQMDPSSFQEGLQNLSFDIFSKLSMEQQHALLQRTEKTKISLSQGSEILKKEKEAMEIKEEADKYYNGTGGVQYNYQHALELYESAANLGNIEAMLQAASMYILGKGTPENAKKAVKWWKKAANLGDIYAMQKLSFLYSQGIIVKQNLETSKYWAQKAKEAKKKNMLIYWSQDLQEAKKKEKEEKEISLPPNPPLSNPIKQSISPEQLETLFNYDAYKQMLDALMKNPEHKIFERDIPLSPEYEKLEKNKYNDPFYKTIHNFDFNRDFMVIYNNEAYWKGLNKVKSFSDLFEEGKSAFQGNPITSPLGAQTPGDPVGYHLYLPNDPRKTKAIIIQVYGGKRNSANFVNDFLPFNNKNMWLSYLLSLGIGILDLDTIDQLANDKLQSEMDKEMYDKVLGSLKTIGEIFSNPGLAKQVHNKLSDLPQSIPLYLYGGSFGGGVVIRALEEYPTLFKGAISFEGVLMANPTMIRNNYENRDYMVPARNLDKLNKNALLIQNYNDNNVKIPETLEFYEKARERGKANLLKMLLLPEGDLESDKTGNIGHSDSSKILYQKRKATAIVDFIEKTKDGVVEFPSQFNDLRYFYHQISYNQHLQDIPFKDKFLSIAFKIYQNSRLGQENTFMKDWFEILNNFSNFKDEKDFRQVALNMSENNMDAWTQVYFPLALKLLVNEFMLGRYDESKPQWKSLSKITLDTDTVSQLLRNMIQSLLKNGSEKDVKNYEIYVLRQLFSSVQNEKGKIVFKSKIHYLKNKKFISLFLYTLFQDQHTNIPFFHELKRQFEFLIQARKRQLFSTVASQLKESAKELAKNPSLEEEFQKIKILEKEKNALKIKAIDMKKDAMEWEKKAKNLDDTEAMFKLGDIYYQGLGFEKDYEQAAAWYQKAAERGHLEAMSKLGDMYFHGQGVKQDYKQAVEWYQTAVDKGNAGAMLRLGDMHFFGLGVPKNLENAMEWYMKAANLGNAEAMQKLGTLYYLGRNVEKDYKKAAEWFLKAAEKGSTTSMQTLAVMYAKGQGVEQNLETSQFWAQKAEEAQNKTDK